MTIFDYIVIGIVGVSLLFGLWRGVVGELIALAAWVLAVIAALEFGGWAGDMVFRGVGDAVLRMLAGSALLFVGVLVLMALVRMLVNSMIKALGLSISDRILGMVFGVLRGLFVSMVLVGLAGMTSMPQQAWWKHALLSQPMETAVLVVRPWLPNDLAKRIRYS